MGCSPTTLWAAVCMLLLVVVFPNVQTQTVVTPLNANTRILEIQDLGQTIITTNATDNAGRTPDVFFTLVNNDAQDQVCNAYFGIFRTGGLYVRSDLVADTLDRTQYICRVIATENNPPSRQSTNTGTVTVTVVRNTRPSFVNSSYTATINRDAGDNALVTTYTTTDGDSDIPFSETDVSIIGRNDNGVFALGGNNTIVLQSATDLSNDTRSSYTLVLQVRDRGERAALSSTAVVNINVVRNLFSPVCVDNNQVISINFTTPPGNTIGTFRATDQDPGQAVKYVLAGTVSSKSYFSVDYDTGDIKLIRALASTGNINYQLSVTAIDNGFPSRTTACPKSVQVNVDASTFAFTFPDYEKTISENNLPPFQVVDLDTSPNDQVFFQVIGLNNGMEWFNIDQTTGSITVAKDLRTDPAKRVVYQLLVQATRQSTVTRQTATASVTINVQRNENSPAFIGNYFRTVDERLLLGNSLVQLTAQDADVNDRLTFRYDSPNADTQLFYLGQSSGLISLNQSLVGLTRDLIQFAVVVEDNAVVNPKSATATVTVSITRDTQPPRFLNDPYSTTINYNLNVGASVFTATATDPDLLGALNYETDNAYLAAPAYFNIERLTGQVVVQNPLTSDSAQSYVLRLKVYDSARPDNFDLTNITINVDRNPTFPAFTPLTYQNRIPETFPPSSEIFTLTATDSDPGQRLQYGIVSATPVNCDDYFYLNVLTGRVSPAQPLTNSGFDRCVITFSVQDNGNPSKSAANSATGTIDIYRNDFAPTFPREKYQITIVEDTARDVVIFDINATDADAPEVDFGNVEFRMIGDDSAVNYFRIEPDTGFIRTRLDNLFNSDKDEYKARIMAIDRGTPPRSSFAVVTIEILRNQNGPVFDDISITRTVYEDAPINEIIFTAVARDTDRAGAQSQLTFSLSGSQAAQSYFNLQDPTSTQQGVYSTALTYARPLYQDNSDTPVYSFTLNAQDNGKPVQSSSIPVTINVIRNLQSPVFSPAYYSVPISYLANVNDVIATVTATDADTDSKYNTSSLRYAIVQGGENTAQTQYFSINPNTGAITLRQRIANDGSTSYVLTVTATDGGTPALIDYATVYFNVNRNQNKPVITSQTLNVTILETENAKDLGTISANDADLQAPFNQLFFSMASTDATIQQYFGVYSNGIVFTRRSFVNLPAPDRFEFEVQVCDRAPTPDTLCADTNGRVVVNVIRNHYPYFVNLPYDRDLDTSFTPGTTVVDVEGVDPDPVNTIFGQLKYSLIGDDGNENAFNIDDNTGVITVGSNTGNVTGEQFQLRIRVCDLGGLCNVTVATITVRTNLLTPELNSTNYRRVIPETWALGETVITVGATDRDAAPPNNQFYFELQTGGGSSSYVGCFTIKPENGVIYPLRALYTAPCNQIQYNFEVVAKDRGRTSLTSVPSTVQIDITRNQNPPQFTQSQYTASIRETAAVGSSVIRISANDLDTLAPFNTLSYTILGDDQATVYFTFARVDNNNIDITVRQSVLNSGQDQYLVQLFVADGGTPVRTDTSVLTITVLRNLNAPLFNPTDYQLTVRENQPLGVSIGQVLAADADAPKPGSGEVTYSLAPGSTNYFGVIASSGVIVVNRDLTLDNLKSQSYVFNVNVRDRGNPSQLGTNTATVTVTVQRNLNCPDLNNSLPTEITINETDTGLIFTAQARDNDITPYFGTPTYSLAGDGANSLFFIDTNSGQITVNSVIQNRNDLVYKLQVIASDGFCLPQAQATLTVNVRRNLFPPRWTPGPNFRVTIRETQDILNRTIPLTAADQDLTGLGSIVSYRFETSSPFQNLFFIGSNGDVYLRRTMVGVSGNSFVVNVRAVDDGGLTSEPGTLNVGVIRNDFTPEILNMPPNTARTVRSDSGLTVEIFTCTSRDNDTQTDYGRVSYRIVGEGRASNMFEVNPSTCEVTLRNALTSDTAQAYTVLIEAYDDAGAATRSSTGTLTINVNRNLNPPRFLTQTYNYEILEIQAVNIPFLFVQAQDDDTVPPYSDIYYETVGNATVLTYFGIDVKGGLVSLRSQWQYPDRTENVFMYGIRLRDGAGQQSSVTASVTVTVIRNTQPVFTNTANYRVNNLVENTVAGTTVFTPTVSNLDSRSPFNDLEFEMIGDGSTTTFFQADPTNGAISVRANTNLETDTASQYIARLVVRDGGTPRLSDTATVVIQVPRNNFSPGFLHGDLTVRIPFNEDIGTVVADVNATDADGTGPEAQITYSMVSGNTFNNIEYFKVYPDTGQLILTENAGLDSIPNDRFVVNLQAVDNGTPRRSGSVTVTVIIDKDPNQLQCTANPFSFGTSENSGLNTVVGDVSAGPAATGTVSYEVVGSPPGTNFFSMTSAGRISISTDLKTDEFKLRSYQLLVKATRSAVSVQPVTCTVSITVTRNENAPVFQFPLGLNNYTVTIPDTTSPGEIIETVSATDADGDIIGYRITSSSPATSAFFLHPERGNVTLTQSLLGTTVSSFVFTVQASDGRGNTAPASVQITITRSAIDRPPQFTGTPYNLPITIYQNPPSNIGTIRCTDPDLTTPQQNTDRIRYRLLGYRPADQYFAVNNQTGQVTLEGNLNLDAAQTQTYTLVVECYDRQNPDLKDQEVVVITVNRNPNCPIFSSPGGYTMTIPENYPQNTFVLNVTASDADGDIVSFFIDQDNAGRDASRYFFISSSTGAIYVSGDLGTAQNIYRFTVSAYDNGTPQCRVRITVTINVERDAGSPTCSQNNLIIPINENALINSTQVYRFQAQDNDVRGDLRFSPTGDALAWAYFQLFEDGRVTVRRSLRTTLTTRFELIASVYDTYYSSNFGTCRVTVTVSHNDGIPSFTSSSYPVQATEQTPNTYSDEAVVSPEITTSNMSFPHTTTMPTTSSGPSEKYGLDAGAIVRAVLGVVAAVDVIIAILVIFLRSTLFREEADVPVSEMVKRPTGQGDFGTLVPRDTTAVNARMPLQLLVGSSTENGASQRPSSETDDDYEIADATSTQQDPAASTTDPTCIEILDDELVDNYDRLQMYENTRDHHDYTDLKSQLRRNSDTSS